MQSNGWLNTVLNYDREVSAFQFYAGDIFDFINKWLPQFEHNDRSYLNIAIGCTGGQHRSVYVASWLKQRFAELGKQVQLKHKEICSHSQAHGQTN